MGWNMDKELELAVDNPQEFLSKPQPNREWDMSIEDIARSINYNPYKSLATKSMVEPEKYSWVSSILAGIGSSVDSIMSESSQATDDILGMYYSPNMTQEQADRLTEDVIYARNFAYKAKQAEDVAYAKDHPELFEFSQGIGSFITFVLAEAINPTFSTYLMYSSSKGQMSEQLADKYIEETGSVRGYAERKKTDDMLSTGFAVLNTAIERGLGMEKIVGRFIREPAKYGKIDYFKAARSQLNKQALKKTGEKALEGFVQEGVLEEAPQSYLEDATMILAGYGAWEDLLSKESFRKAAKSAWYGGIIGAGAGATMFNVSRARVKRDIAQWADEHKVKLTDLQVTQAADTFINKGQEALLNDLTTRAELKTKHGKAFEILVDKVKEQIKGTGQSLPEGQDLDKFARVVAKTIQIPAQNLSLWSNIPVEDYLNAANIRVINGMWELEPLQSSQEVKSLLDKQKAIIKEQNKLKKLGTENINILDNAKRRKNELQVIYDNLVRQESIESVKTFRKKQNIDYVKAKDLLPEQTRSIEGVKEATDEEDFVVFAGKKIPVSYEVVELDSIQPSHINGEINKNYTNKELQNRASRGTTIDVADLRNKALDFTPELVLTAPTSAQGAPITNAKGEVIAGNGRAEIIRMAYAENPEGAEKYKKALEKLGFNLSGMNKPILIRRNTTMNEEQQISAADISNIQEASAFDAASRAKQDSKYLKDSASITDFASKLPMSERRGLMLNNGTWNMRAVRQRYEEALLSWLCGNDTKLYENLVLGGSLPQKIIEPLVANGNAIVDLQEKYPDIDIRADIYGALVKYQRTNKDNFTSVMQEQELNGRDVMPENVVLWNFIFNNNTTIKMFFDNYTKTASANREAVNAGEDMFGQKVAPLSKKDLYAQALKKTDEIRSQIATESNKKYDPLFTETGEITDANLQSAFISYQNQFNTPSNTGALFQEELVDKKELVVTHGISLGKLEKALELGGFPVPSIAITKASEPLTDFGEITLIGTKDIINPVISANKVYDRDIWSITVPQEEYNKIKTSELKKFVNKFENYFIKADEKTSLSSIEYTLSRTLPSDATREFENSNGTKLAYVEMVLNEKVEIPTKENKVPNMYGLKPDAQFIDDVLKIGVAPTNAEVVRGVTDAARSLIKRTKYIENNEDYNKRSQDIMLEGFPEDYSGGLGKMDYIYYSIKRYVSTIEEKGNTEVDTYALSELLDKKIEGTDYWNWAEKQMQEVLGAKKVRIGNKLADWTLDNLTEAMIRGEIKNAQKPFLTDYTIGKIIAAGAKELKSIEDIRKAGKNLKTKEEADALTDELGGKIVEYAEKFVSETDFTSSMYQKDAVLRALGKTASKNNVSKSILQNALRYELATKTQYPDELLQEGLDILKATKEVMRYYFEAKPERSVALNEFVGAIVPTNEKYNNIAKNLEERGLKVERTDDLRAGIQNVESSVGDVLFQGSKTPNAWYDPELQIIALTKKWNNLSLVHEMHHRYLGKLIDVYNQAQNGLVQMTELGKQEIKNLFDMLDIADPMHLTAEELTVAQERFAAMTEAYLSGLGVQENQNQVYKDFLAWIPEKYKSILNIGYLNEKNEIVNPLLDQSAIDFFNRWFSEPQMPALPTSPVSQSLINPTDDKDEIIPSSQKEMNDREIKWGVDSAEQIEADKKLYAAIDEDTPNDLRAAIDGAKVELHNMPVEDAVSMPQIDRERWFKTGVENAQERMAIKAKDYVEKNKEHAIELALADPEISTVYDAPVDRAWLIRAVMDITDKTSEEYAIMYDNLATYRSMSGSTLGLTNDMSQKAYLDAKREIENSREMKAVINYAGNNRGAWSKWTGDIKSFINARVGKILATEAGSPERKVAIQSFIEEAKTKFSGNTENAILNQLDLTGVNARSKAAFIKWAEKTIKQAVGVGLDNATQKKLIDASMKAQQAMLAIDNSNSAISSAAARDLRNWQILKDELKKSNFGKFDKFNNAVNNLMGGYVPSAMLMSFNTLFVANLPSTAINNAIIRSSMEGIYKKQLVSKSVLKAEEKRIRDIYKSSGMNIAQMEKPTSPSLMHGEKYMGQEKSKWYDFTFKVLSWGDNLFRIPTFVETLGRIASKNANGDAKLAEEKFRMYSQLNTTDEEAKLARKQALAISNMAVFTQDGILSTGLNHVRDSINKMSRGLLGLDKEGFGLGNLLAPFLKTGANVVEMGITGAIAPIRTVAFGLKKLNGKEIPEIQKIALRSDWKVFAFTALSVALLSALTSDDDDLYIEPYEPGQKYDPNRPYDSINIGGLWIKLDTFGVFSVPIRVAVKFIKDKNLFTAYGFGLQEAIGETPLLNNLTTDPTYMFKKPGKWAQGFGYNMLNKFVPAQAKPIIRAGSRAIGVEYKPEFLGDYLQRRFNRNYGLDGVEPTTNDYINIFTNRLKFIE